MDDGRRKSEVGNIAGMATVAGAFIGASSGRSVWGGYLCIVKELNGGEEHSGNLLCSAAIS